LAHHLPTDDVFMTAEEVLEYLQVNLRTVYRLARAGKIPAVRVGRQWRFKRRDIDAWLGSQGARGSSPSPSGSAADLRGGHRILVVDDESTIRDMLSRTLSQYEVETVSDAAAALELLRVSNVPYHLLIADLKMPGMDGLSLIRKARELRAGLPIIIITGFSTESSAIEAVNLGVAGYLTKPFHMPQVVAAAEKAMGVSASAS
jgi:excisionase family DNA binding protein